MPKEWYEQFKALINEKLQEKNAAGCLLGLDGKPLLDFDAVTKGTKLTELNEAQAGKLYEAAKTGGLIIPAENKANSQVIYNDKENKPQILAPNMNIINEENPDAEEVNKWQQPLKAAVENFSKLEDSEIVSEEKIKDYSIAAKTMTDLYGGPGVEMPLDNNYIMDAEGHYISKTGNVWKDYDIVSKAIKSGNHTFITFDKEKDNQELFYTFKKDEKTENYAKQQLEAFGVIKLDTINEFAKLGKELEKNVVANKDVQPLLDGWQTAMTAMEKAANKAELEADLKTYAETADKFLQGYNGQKINVADMAKLNSANKIKSIGEAVKNGVRPSVADDKAIHNPLSDWYTDFKEMIKNDKVLTGNNGSLYLRGNSDEPLIDLKDAFKGVDLMHLNDSQIQRLHDISKSTGIMVYNPEKPENPKLIYADDKGILKSSDAESMKTKENRESCPKMVLDSLDKYSKIPAEQKIGEAKINELNNASKTITDMYGGADIEEVLAAEWVLDADGNPLKKEDNPWASYGKVADALKGESEVYFQGIYNKETGKEESYKFHKNPETKQVEKTLQNEPVMKGAVKEDVIKELKPIAAALAIYKTKNASLNAIKSKIDTTIEELELTNGKEEFNKKLGSLGAFADFYYQQKSGTKLSKTGADKLEMVSRIREIRDACLNDKLPSETPLDKVKFMQTQLAAKFVKGYAVSMRDYSKDPVLADKAREMLLDHKAFEKGVNEIMANPAFQYLYGSRKEGDMLDTIHRINEGMDLKASQLVKNVKVEAELPSKDRPAFESYMKQQAPKRIDATRGINGRLALSRHAEILDALEDMRKQLTAVGRSGAASAELQNLEKELAISTIRLQNGNNFMNVKAQLAQLGDAADAYMSKVMNSKMNGRRFQRFNIANQIKEVCDAVAEDKPVAENVKHGDELKRDSLAARLANQVAKELLKSDSPAAQKRGKRMLLEPKIFEAEKEKLMDSEAFQNLYNTSGAIEDAIESNPESVYKDFLAEKKRTEPEIVKNGPDRKRLEEKAIEKEKEDKMISLSF